MALQTSCQSMVQSTNSSLEPIMFQNKHHLIKKWANYRSSISSITVSSRNSIILKVYQKSSIVFLELTIQSPQNSSFNELNFIHMHMYTHTPHIHIWMKNETARYCNGQKELIYLYLPVVFNSTSKSNITYSKKII